MNIYAESSNGKHRYWAHPPLICERCGSPDIREVERVARSTETVAAEAVSWMCQDCGMEQR